MAKISKKQFQKLWDKSSRNPFKTIPLPSGGGLVSNNRNVFVIWLDSGTERIKAQAITRNQEWFGSIFRVTGILRSPRDWELVSIY